MTFVLLAHALAVLICCAFAYTARDEPAQGIGSARPSWHTWSTDDTKEL